MNILTAFLVIWGLLNVSGIFIIAISSAMNAEYDKLDLLFYPLLIGTLSEKLNKIGVIIATTFVSLFFAPAIIFYFTSLIFVGIIYLVCQGFVKLFKKKD
jgi:hypothetical protein